MEIKHKLKYKVLNELQQTSPYWIKVINWFHNYKPQDNGIKYIWDSFFTDEYLQSKAMIEGMAKQVLYLYRSHKDKTFPYEYNAKRISFIENWFKENLKLTEGSFYGKPFELAPPQTYILSLIWGFSKKESFKDKEEIGLGLIFMTNRLYLTATRKNGKSQFFAGIADFLVHNPFGNDHQPEIFATGPVQEASRIIYKKAQDMVKINPRLDNEFKRNNLRAFETYSGGIIKDLPFAKEAIEGKNPSLGIATEYHLHPNDLMVESFESAKNLSRPNSLLLFDTTKGEGINGVAYTREFDYKDIIIKQLEDPESVFSPNIATFMAEVDDEDDPEDIENPWETNPLRKSTPMLGKTLLLGMLQQEWQQARLNPTRKREFLIKKFGRWIGNLQSMFQLDDFIRCNKTHEEKYKLEDFKGKNAIVSIDLANTGDTNAISIFFKDKDELGNDIIIQHAKIFIPEETLRERILKERKPYDKWIEEGYVVPCGEKSVDYQVIANYIKELIETYSIQSICYDPWHFHVIETYLINTYNLPIKGILKETKNAASNLSAPMNDIINKVVNARFYAFNNPVLVDHFINMKPSFNSQGQIYFTKQKQTHRIDIFATSVMALANIEELPYYNTKITSGWEAW